MSAHLLPYGGRGASVLLDDATELRAAPGALPAPDPRALAHAAVRALPPGARQVCLVVPDRTREAALPWALPPLLSALAAAGKDPRPPCVFASGTHAPMSPGEMRAALGAAAPLVTPLAHRCDDPALVEVARGPEGDAVHLHPEIAQADAVVVVGAMAWHYLAGFGGGRKLLLPGASSRAAATAVHARCLVADPPGRAPGARPGTLEDNPLHQAIAARLGDVPARAAGIALVLDAGVPTDGEAGPLFEHHARLARRFAAARTVTAEGPLDAVALSCGGAPFDVDLVQAHKALVAIAPVLREGGRVALFAELPRGYGHKAMRAWLRAGTLEEQLQRLLTDFSIGEHTAWSLRALLARFDVGLVSSLPDDEVRGFGARPLEPAEVPAFLRASGPRLGVAPLGAALRYVLST